MAGGFMSSLRVRLGLLFLVAVIPTVILQAVVFIMDRRQAAADAYQEALGLARVAAAEQDRDIAQTRQLLSVLAEHPGVRRLDPEACSRLAANLISPVHANIGAATSEGRVFCSALPAGRPVSVADRSWFQRALATRDFAVGDYQVGRITGKPSINLGYPVRDSQGKITAVAFAALDLERLNDAAAQAKLHPGSALTVLDEHGTILARFPDPSAWVGRTLPEADLFKAIQGAGAEGVMQAHGLDGVHRLYGFAVLPSSGRDGRVYVTVGIPASAAFADANRGFVFNLAGLALVGLATLATLVIGANLLVLRPFDSLIRATERLSAGDLSARTGGRYQIAELQQLTGAFDRMAEALEQREAQRLGAEEKITQQLETLTLLYSGAQRLTRSLDLRTLGADVVRTLVGVFGATSAWLGRAEPDGRVDILAVFPEQQPGGPSLAGTLRWDDSPHGRGTTGRAIRSGFPVIVTNPVDDPAMAPWGQQLAARGIRSVAAFPLITRDETFGVVGLSSTSADFFTPDRTELLQAFANQAAAALENARLFEESERRIARLGALRAIDQAITGSLELRVSLAVLLEQVARHLQVDAADVLLFNPHTQVLEYAAGRGFQSPDITRSHLRLGQGYAGKAALERRLLEVADLSKSDGFARTDLVAREGFVSYHAVPLLAKGQVQGVLEVFHRAPVARDGDWLEFLEALAGQAAIAVDNATLFDGLSRSNTELMLAYDTTIEGWSRALDLRDKETEGHTQRVADLTLRLARAMGMTEDQIVHVRRGALLHDIGKMGVPDGILLKPGPLTDAEWEIMRRHPVSAFELLAPISYLRPALDIPYAHHEKWDGTGYPRGLKAEQIPLAARIFAVVDVWDALTSDRPYRAAWPKEKTLQHIRDQAGRHFDPRVVQVFVQLLDQEDVPRAAGL